MEDVTPLQGLLVLCVGLFLGWLGITGRIRYSGRASCLVLLVIFAGLYFLFVGIFN